MAKLFISHSYQDKDFAEDLKAKLVALGHTPWWFEDGISVGQKWQEAILDHLRDVDALVILVSEASSKSAWVNHELGAALAYSEERGTPIIIPVVIDKIDLVAPLSRYFAIYKASHTTEQIAEKISIALEKQAGVFKAKEEERTALQQKVEVSAASFIEKSLLELRERETTYRRLAYFWYSVAYATLVASAAFGVWRLLIQPTTPKDWSGLVEFAISGLLVLALLIGLAKYAFTLGKSFMVEALRNADRRHAISFGEFFLRAYGAHAQWSEVKEAFQNWNIDKGSHFIGQSGSEFDPQVLALAVDLAKAIAGRSESGAKKA
jgi:nucleotide-binding universal stress UspA family protein